MIQFRNFKEALRHRRSYYQLSPSSPVSDQVLQELLVHALQHVPSAFNSQSTRLMLLLDKSHQQLWQITKEVLKEKVPSAEAFARTESKINTSFASGYGTVLFWEDQTVVRRLQSEFPTYSKRFPTWAQQTSAMHQLAVWTMLEDLGFGASLQHYNPLIDQKVRDTWQVSPDWELIAQMPFGMPLDIPASKESLPLDQRLLIFT